MGNGNGCARGRTRHADRLVDAVDDERDELAVLIFVDDDRNGKLARMADIDRPESPLREPRSRSRTTRLRTSFTPMW